MTISIHAMPSPVSGRLLRRGLIAGAVVLVLAGGAAAIVLLHSPGNVSHPNLEFTNPTVTQPPKKRRVVVDRFLWPWYGFDAGRTRTFTANGRLHPPLRVAWKFFDGGLLEFPPVIYRTMLYVLDDNGSLKAVDTVTGRLRWQKRVGSLAAASPVVAARQQLVLAPLLSVNKPAGGRVTPGNGRFVGVSMRNGRVVWSRPIAAGSESSPIVHGDTVYYGDQAGILRAMRVRDGHQFWTYHASGAIKGGPALVNGVLYFGDYAGRAYAINARTGHQVWAVGTNGARFGFGSGQFYSSPAVAFGRVYMGNTDGRVYSFGARNGALAWATGTGAFVYASPAVADVRGLGPTVYLGSYDGNFYAFNAQSGGVRWRHAAGGKISGSATIIGNVVYYSDLSSKSSVGLNVRTGRQVFSFPDGAFNAVIADYGSIFLDGYAQIYRLVPAGPKARHRAVPRAGRRHRRHPATATRAARARARASARRRAQRGRRRHPAARHHRTRPPRRHRHA
jgi:outer membrane protein assembly factor BamB